MKMVPVIPHGTVFNHLGTRIVFVEWIDDFVARFVVEGTQDEYFVTDDSVRVRPTFLWLARNFANGDVYEETAAEAALGEWRARFLKMDRATCLIQEPRSVLKYDLAIAALAAGKPRNAATLEAFAAERIPDGFGPICGRSLIRWMSNLEDHGARIGAMRNRSGRQSGSSPLPCIADRLVHQSMALFWSVEALQKMDANALVTTAWHGLKAQGVEDIGDKAPTKTTVINRINANECKQTWETKFGKEQADRHFVGSGEMSRGRRPFDLVFIDGTEFRQVCRFSDDAEIVCAKMKVVQLIDSFSLFAFPAPPFAGPYRSEMGMLALMNALTPPLLDDETLKSNPALVMCSGRIGRLRGDNEKAILPPTAISNLTTVIGKVELAKKYGPNEKSDVEAYFGWVKGRMEGEPGTVLSPRSRRRSFRRDPMTEATMSRDSISWRYEQLRLEWNDTGHDALGGRTPNDVMLEHAAINRIRFNDPKEVRRNLARTVRGVLTTDGAFFDGIRYRWNRTGVTNTLSENLAAQAFTKRLTGTARCDVWMKVYDWNLDMIEILDEANNDFVPMWSTDPDYTTHLTRYEHNFHVQAQRAGATGAPTDEENALVRGTRLQRAWEDLHNKPFQIAKKAAAVIEAGRIRVRGGHVRETSDMTDFAAFRIEEAVVSQGRDRDGIPKGPLQSHAEKDVDKVVRGPITPIGDWTGQHPQVVSGAHEPEDEHGSGAGHSGSEEADDADDGIDWGEEGDDDAE
ncbi:hypothetical protein [uncultured Sphingomonas sp.]|uniref:hypothetical protein n=1 Tax=uncultured Sphingomonas sp. TaxID=158754 RepID=UPI001576DE16